MSTRVSGSSSTTTGSFGVRRSFWRGSPGHRLSDVRLELNHGPLSRSPDLLHQQRTTRLSPAGNSGLPPAGAFIRSSGPLGARRRTRAASYRRIEARELEAGAQLTPSLPLQRGDPYEERDDDGHRDRLQQPFGACDRESDQARNDDEECEAPSAAETTQASVIWTPITHGAPILDRTLGDQATERPRIEERSLARPSSGRLRFFGSAVGRSNRRWHRRLRGRHRLHRGGLSQRQGHSAPRHNRDPHRPGRICRFASRAALP